MKKSFIGEKNICLNIAKKYFKENKRKSLKNIIHAIRYLQFGIQILKKQKIYDYQCANEYYYSIMKKNYDNFDQYLDDYMVIIQKLEDEFLEIIDYCIKTREKWDKKIGKLTVLEFLKEHPIESLNFYFNVEVTKNDDHYRVISRLDDHLIARECNSLIFSLDKKLLAYSYSKADPNASIYNIKAKNYNVSRIYKIEFLYYKQFDEVWTYSHRNYQYKEIPKELSDYKNICFLCDHMGDIFGAYNLNTLEQESIEKFKDFPLFKIKEYDEDEVFNSIEDLKKWMDDEDCMIENVRTDLFECFVVHSGQIEIIEKIVKKEIKQEDGIFEFVRRYKKEDYSLPNYIERNYPSHLVNQLEKFMEKYENILERLNEIKYEIIEESYYKQYEIDSKNRWDLRNYLKSVSLERFKEIINHKFIKEKLPTIPYYLIPKDVFEVILSFMDVFTIRNIALLVSKEFSWIQKSNHLINEIFSKITTSFSKKTFKLCEPFFQTNIFQLFSRILPYCEIEIGKTFSLYDHLYLLSPRNVNSLELGLFQMEDKTPQPKSIVSYSEFLKRFEEQFFFSQWKDIIYWKRFFIVGGSILNSILKEQFNTNDQDVDFFYYGSHSQYDEYFYEFLDKLKKFESVEIVPPGSGYYDRSRTISLKINDKKLNLQFNQYNFDSTKGLFFQTLDQDCCQVGFNGTQVLATYSFIQSLNTGTFMNYHLWKDNGITEHSEKRINKYKDRGFVLMYPKGYDYSNRKMVQEEEVDKRYYNYTPFEENNDSMHMVEEFLFYCKIKDPPEVKDPEKSVGHRRFENVHYFFNSNQESNQ